MRTKVRRMYARPDRCLLSYFSACRNPVTEYNAYARHSQSFTPNAQGTKMTTAYGKILGSLAATAIGFAIAASPALAEGDAGKGARQFNKCKTCHALEEGKNKIGPSLHGLIGRTAATVDGFRYSPAMQESGITWDMPSLDAYIESPKNFVPKGSMAFAGIRNPTQRADLLAYLQQELGAE